MIDNPPQMDDVGENGHLHESDVGVADDRQSTADFAEK
jgi:hypothetical protein